MMEVCTQYLVHLNQTYSFSLSKRHVTIDDIKEKLAERSGTPCDRIELYVNGYSLQSINDQGIPIPVFPTIIRARLLYGLCGGKGGFGVMLRNSGKGAGAKVTTNFGACRDLNGRRLRHVNQEIAAQKWAKEKEEREHRKKIGISDQEIMEEETPSGIPGWYLSTPSWAEGVPKSYMKRRRNTALCKNWIAARENGVQPPPNAPRWWGCPRGRGCSFAHGEEELRGEALTDLKRRKKETEYEMKSASANNYLNYEEEIKQHNILSAVQEGLRRRVGDKQQGPVEGLIKENTINDHYNIPDSITSKQSDEESHAFMEADGNSALISFKFGMCEARGCDNFATVKAINIKQLPTGYSWYYEVKLITNGVIQVGWIDNSVFHSNSSSGDGVGDHERSWSYDGCRQKKWNSGKDEDYGKLWVAGDVIGCSLDMSVSDQTAAVSFSKNGIPLGRAFEIAINKTSRLLPAFSLEEGEIVLVNFGHNYPLLYHANTQVPVSYAEKLLNENEIRTEVENPDNTEIDLMKYQNAKQLEELGLEVLKVELQRRGLKAGGTLEERANRLFSIQGKLWEQIDSKIKVRKSQDKKHH